MFNTLGIEILYVPLGEGFINFRILFFKIHRFSEFLIDLSRLLHSIITEKKRVFETIAFKMKMRHISRQSCVMRGGLKR